MGRTIRVIAVPGHTKGSIVLLDEENKLLFLGDAANSRTPIIFEYSSTIEEYYGALLKLKKLESSYDKFYIAHGLYDAPKTCLDDLLELCELL